MSATTSTGRLTIGKIMTKNPVYVDGATTARELAAVLDENEVSGAPVVDPRGCVVGVVSRTDLLHRCLEGPLGSRPGGSFLSAIAESSGGEYDAEVLGTVSDFMNPDPITATVDESVNLIAKRMHAERVHRVVVVDDDGRLQGIVTSLDLVRLLSKE